MFKLPTDLIAVCCLLLALAASALSAEVRLSGRITDETGEPVAGAEIIVDTIPRSKSFKAISDPTGTFALWLPKPATYSLKIDREDFYVYSQSALAVPLESQAGRTPEFAIVLQTIHKIRTVVDVNDQVGLVDMDRTTPQTTLSSRTLYDVPFPDQNSLRSGLRMIPGVLQDSTGGLHLFGGAETQTEFTFEGFQLNDPLTGRLDARMSLESIQSVDVVASESGADSGRGAAGTMAMHVRSGVDKYRYSATSLFPSASLGKGLRVTSWTPRTNVAGPWIKGKAWFFNATELNYTNTTVPTLPAGQNTARSWRGSELLHNQININEHSILYAGLLYNYISSPHSGLSDFNPLSTTLNLRSTEWLGYIKHQHSFSRGLLVELGVASSRTTARSFPKGDLPYLVTPSGYAGNNFTNGGRSAGRDQGLTNVFVPSFSFFGQHQIKTGADVIHLQYAQNVDRSSIDYESIDGAVLRTISFSGSGNVARANNETSFYVQDGWRVNERLLVELGWRLDHDQLLHRTNPSPRAGFSWSPPHLERIRFSGAFSRVFDPTDLRLFVRPLDQSAVTNYFNAAGALIYGPVLSVYKFGPNVQSPRADVWNLAAESALPRTLQLKVQLLKRRSYNGFDYESNVPASEQLPAILAGAPNPGPLMAVYQLNNDRQDKFDSAEISIRRPLKGRYEWMVSYTRSHSLSNVVLDRNIDQPLAVANDVGPLPWDAPNRLVNWGYLPTLWKNWSLAYLLDWHSGFPFSVQDQYGNLIGSADNHRFVQFFELNLFAEREIAVRGYVALLRGGFNNITGHQNSTVVDNVVGGPNFLHESGGQARAFAFSMRFLGKQQ